MVPLIVAGGAGVVAIVGGVMYLSGKSKVDEVESTCPNRKCPVGQENLISEGNDARNKQNLGGAVFGIGLAGMIAGVIWYATSTPSAPSGPPARASLTPVVGTGFTGVSLGGRF
jgi:hypothetical protein